MIAFIIILIVSAVLVSIYLTRRHSFTQTMKVQRKKYIQSLQREQIFHRRIPAAQLSQLRRELRRVYLDAGNGCYIGQGAFIYLKNEGTQVTIQLFGPTEDELARHAWRFFRVGTPLEGA